MSAVRTLILSALALFVVTQEAHAQATRTWVSGVGDDANPCSRTAPCKTFAGAISKTAASGEINIIDPGGYGAVTITKSISIIAVGGTAGVLTSAAGSGIIINAGVSDVVYLEGLDIEGAGVGATGVRVLQAGNVTIRNCTIRDFVPLNSAGIRVENTAAITAVAVYDSILTNNDFGINVTPAAAVSANVLVERVSASKNRIALRAASNGIIRLSASSIAHNVSGLQVIGSGSIRSFGNNVVDGNVQLEVPSQTILLK